MLFSDVLVGMRTGGKEHEVAGGVVLGALVIKILEELETAWVKLMFGVLLVGSCRELTARRVQGVVDITKDLEADA